MLLLERSYLEHSTIGKLFYNGNLVAFTIERPWLNNAKSISCIPEGEYDLNRYDSAKHPDCFSLTCHDLGVGLTADYHRNYILIHSGNYATNLEGCIAPGLQLHQTLGSAMVQDSKSAMEKIRVLIHNNQIRKIKIKG